MSTDRLAWILTLTDSYAKTSEDHLGRSVELNQASDRVSLGMNALVLRWSCEIWRRRVGKIGWRCVGAKGWTVVKRDVANERITNQSVRIELTEFY